MPYLCYLPRLLFGIAVSAHDVRTRRIPRAWIACGVLCQLVAFTVAAAYAGRWEALAGALTGMVAGAGIQLALALIRPGAVGLGDVTLCALVGCAVGGHSPTAFVLWWMCMAAIGAGWILAWQALRHMQMTGAHGKAPFAPVIVAAGVAAIAFLG